MHRLTRNIPILLILAACNSSSAPDDIARTPELATITERQMIYQDSVTMRDGQRWLLELTVRGAELQLAPDGSYQQAVTYFARFNGTLGFGGTWTDSGGWTRQGDSLFFESALVDTLEYAAALTDTGLELRQDILGLGGIAVYRYIG